MNTLKTLLCYGDSNTWGYIPGSGGRFDENTRWPGVLRGLLNRESAAWLVEEDGVTGRTTCRDDTCGPYRNGLASIMPALLRCRPVNAVAVMLGTNDLQHRFSPSAYDTAQGLLLVVKAIQRSECGPDNSAPSIIVICPPRIIKPTTRYFSDSLDEAMALSAELPKYMRKIARLTGSAFLDAGAVVTPSARDGAHLDAEGHRKLAEAVAKEITGLGFETMRSL